VRSTTHRPLPRYR